MLDQSPSASTMGLGGARVAWNLKPIGCCRGESACSAPLMRDRWGENLLPVTTGEKLQVYVTFLGPSSRLGLRNIINNNFLKLKRHMNWLWWTSYTSAELVPWLLTQTNANSFWIQTRIQSFRARTGNSGSRLLMCLKMEQVWQEFVQRSRPLCTRLLHTHVCVCLRGGVFL